MDPTNKFLFWFQITRIKQIAIIKIKYEFPFKLRRNDETGIHHHYLLSI